MGTNAKTHIGDILLVDDSAANLRVLSEMLKSKGYKVRPIPNGQMALEVAQKSSPDLVLLDILMPDMDGYECCRKMKQLAVLKDIPVIFISALDAPLDKVKAFSVGGVDYIKKPFQIEEVCARVNTHISLRRANQDLQKQHLKLEENFAKLKQLEELRDSLTYMMVHDMRSPLTVIHGYIHMLKVLGEKTTMQDRTKYFDHISQSCEALIEMISSMLDISKLEDGKLMLNYSPCNVGIFLTQIAEKYEKLTNAPSFKTIIPTSCSAVLCDPPLIERVISNLVGNAVKFTSKDGNILLTMKKGDEAIEVSVRDTGMGIPKEYHKKIFDKFGQVEMRQQQKKYSTGLGLTFCKLVIEEHGGSIKLESEEGEGSTFSFTLPLQPRNDP